MIFNRLVSVISLSLITLPVLAQNAAPAPQGDPMKSIFLQLPVILAMLGILYLGVLRPQNKQQKRQSDFLSSLKKGEEVITSGGILGTIVGITDKVVTLEIANKIEIKVLKSGVQGYLSEAIPASNK